MGPVGYLEDLMHLLGSAVCHQNPARSFMGYYLHLPLCGRCTGLYLGVLAAVIAAAARRAFPVRRSSGPDQPDHRSGLLPWPVAIAVLVSLAALLPIEVAAEQFLGFDSMNIIRALTGLSFGGAAAFAVGAVLGPETGPGTDGELDSLRSVRGIVVLVVSILVLLVLLSYPMPLLRLFLGAASILSLLFAYAFVNRALVLAFFPSLSSRRRLTAAIVLPLVTIEFGLLYSFSIWVRTNGRFL